LTFAQTEPSELREIAEPAEMLIKEAHDAARRRRLGWLTVFIAIALVFSLIVASVVASSKPRRQVGSANARPSRSALAISPCTISSLRITVQNGDGLHHGVEFMRFVNVSANSCKLIGYPKVSAILDSAKEPVSDAGMYAPATPGALEGATNVQWSWAGGVDVNDTPLKTFVAPTIVLAPHKGMATSTLNWIDGPNGDGTCPAFNDLIIGIGTASVTRFVRAFEPLCYEFAVTPIVRGDTGSMFVKSDYSKKANDLADAEAEASNLDSEVATLHHEMEHPNKYSFSQKMQAASYVQQFSQYSAENSPWPKLNSLLAIVDRESGTLGNHAIMSLMKSSSSAVVESDYLRLLTSMKSLDNVLNHLS
jgi:hypothetical protein